MTEGAVDIVSNVLRGFRERPRSRPKGSGDCRGEGIRASLRILRVRDCQTDYVREGRYFRGRGVRGGAGDRLIIRVEQVGWAKLCRGSTAIITATGE